jgi:hypothetical protein
MSDVTIVLTYGERSVTVVAVSLAQARSRVGAVWPLLFPPGPESQAAALEVVMTEIAESLSCAS